MHKAIGSRKDFSRPEDDALLAEYHTCVKDLFTHEMVQKMDEHVQHCDTSRLQHSINVSYYSFLICYRMGWDYRSAARAGLLHDLFFYDWRTKKYLRSNAKKITTLNKVEKDAILKHMWPCTVVPPRYIESYVLTFVDKTVAVMEMVQQKYAKVFKRAVA